MKMRNWKRITTVWLSMAVVVTMLPILSITAGAAGTPFIFTDNFEYSASAQGKGAMVGQNWQTSNGLYTSGYGTAQYSTVADPNNAQNKVMTIYTGNDAGAINLVASHVGISPAQVFQVDMRGSQTSGSSQYYGIRLMLDAGTSQEMANMFSLYIYGGNLGTIVAVNGQNSFGGGDKAIDTSVWCTYKIIVNGLNISWIVTEKSTGEVKWSSSTTLSSAKDFSAATATVELFSQGFNAGTSYNAYLDNVIYRDYDIYLDNGSEPNNVIYQNVATKSSVISPASSVAGINNANDGDIATTYTSANGVPYALDLGKAYSLRRIQMVGLSNAGGPIDIKGSNDASTWTTMTNTGSTGNGGAADFNWVNFVDASPYRYVKLERQNGSENYSFGELRVLNYLDPGKCVNVPISSSIYLFPRINGTDVFTGATWTSSNLSAARVANGVVSPLWCGTTAITASSGGNSIAVNVNIGGYASFYDNFEYSASAQGKGAMVGQNWQTSNGLYTSGYGTAQYSTVADPNNAQNKVMTIYTGNDAGAINLVAPHSGISPVQMFQVDMRGSQTTGSSQYYGIRLMLDAGTDQEMANMFSLYNYQGTLGTIVAANGQNSFGGGDKAADPSVWCTYKIIINGLNISWIVTDKSTGAVKWSSNASLSSAKDFSVNTATVQLFSQGFNDGTSYNAYYDNVIYKSYDQYIDSSSEPDSVMYQNVACDKPVIAPASSVANIENANDGNTSASYTSTGGAAYTVDLGAAYPIRRVQLLGLSNTNGPINIEVSNDASTWLALTDTGSTGSSGAADWNWVNIVSANQYRFIKIVPQSGSNNYSFTELRAFTDVTGGSLSVKLHSGLYLFPRIAGADAFTGASWTNSQDGYVSVYNGTILQPISKTSSGPVAVTATSGGHSVNTNVTVTDAYSIVNNNDTLTITEGAKATKISPTAILGFYDSNNKLIKTEIVNLSLNNKNVDEITYSATNYSASKIKAFLWDGGLVNIKPIVPAVVIN